MAVSGLKLMTLPSVTVTTAGTAVPVYTSSLLVYAATIQSVNANTGTGYFGDSTVSSSNGIEVPIEGIVEIESPAHSRGDQFDVSELYLDSSVNGETFRVVVWVRG